MNNKYVTVEGDKFGDMTKTHSQTVQYKLSGRGIGLYETVDLRITHVSSSEGETDAIVIHFKSVDQQLGRKMSSSSTWTDAISSGPGEWAFLRNGRLIIRVNDVENIPVEAHEINSDVTSTNIIGHQAACEEQCAYFIDKEILEKVAGANQVELKLTGGASGASWILPGLDFIHMAQSVYSSVYDSDRFKVEMEHTENIMNRMADIESQKKSIRRWGCFFEIVALFGIAYIAESLAIGPNSPVPGLFMIAVPIIIEIYVRKKKNSIG